LIHVDIFPLPPQQVPNEGENANNQADRTSPPDDGCPQQVELCLCVTPSTHTQAEVKEWPVKRFGSKYVFLIWVRDQRVVGRHHRNIEMPKISQERRPVELGVARWYWKREINPSDHRITDENKGLRTSIVPMALHIPIGVSVCRRRGFGARNFNLLESPLR
jgi:hypothetical protein